MSVICFEIRVIEVQQQRGISNGILLVENTKFCAETSDSSVEKRPSLFPSRCMGFYFSPACGGGNIVR